MLSKNRYCLLFLLFIAVVSYSCAPALYLPQPEQTAYEQLLKGRQLYVNSCGSCHSLHLPNQYQEEVWKQNLDEMQARAKISNEDKALILEYLKSEPSKSSNKTQH